MKRCAESQAILSKRVGRLRMADCVVPGNAFLLVTFVPPKDKSCKQPPDSAASFPRLFAHFSTTGSINIGMELMELRLLGMVHKVVLVACYALCTVAVTKYGRIHLSCIHLWYFVDLQRSCNFYCHTVGPICAQGQPEGWLSKHKLTSVGYECRVM